MASRFVSFLRATPAVAAVAAAKLTICPRSDAKSPWPFGMKRSTSQSASCDEDDALEKLKRKTGVSLLKTDRKQIAILGGSFDPVTNAHILQAAEIMHAEKADEVWLVPCGPRPDKPSLKTPYLDRLIMCHLAIDATYGSRFPLRVSDVEMPFPQYLPTLDCIEELEKQHPDKDFSFVLGSDLLPDLLWWEEGERQKRLLSKKFLVFSRPGYEMEKRMVEEAIPSWANPKTWPEGFEAGKLSDNFQAVTASAIGTEVVSQNLSSSEIRKRFRQDYSLVEGLVPAVVLNHMLRYHLYRD